MIRKQAHRSNIHCMSFKQTKILLSFHIYIYVKNQCYKHQVLRVA